MILTLYSDPTAFKNGFIVPSGSVLYTGATLEILQNSTTPIALPCNGNLNQAISFFDQAVNNLLVQNNLTELTPENLTFNPATITINELHQIEINAISANIASIAALQTQLAGLTANSLSVTMNMQCLAAGAAPCESAPGIYPLIGVLNSMLTEICAIKSYLGI